MGLINEIVGVSAGSGAHESAVKRALEAVRTHLGMEVAYVSEFVDGNSVFREVDAPGLEALVKVGDTHSLDDVYCRHILEGRLPELMPDTAAEPLAASMPITSAVPIGAHVSVPIHRPDGSAYGMFCCFSFQPNLSLNQRDLQITKAFAGLAAEQIGRALESSETSDATIRRIRETIAQQDFTLVFQPIFDFRQPRPTAFECLTRFPSEPVRTPDVWFNEAAEIGLGVELECAVLRLAAISVGAFPADVTLSVNASPATMMHRSFHEVLAGMPIERIVLEITEHAPVEDYGALLAALRPLRDAGMRLAVDDAGAGYSSLQHILQLEPDMIKLDMGLTRNVDTDPARRALAAALILFAGETGSQIVAEGIETSSELATLQALGVRKGQGYLLGRPLALDDALRLTDLPVDIGKAVA